MRSQGLAINPNALAKYAGIACKSVYHRDRLEQIRAESAKPAPSPSTAASESTNESSIVAALRDQLRAQKHRYQTEIAELKTEVKTLEQALAAAHGELHPSGNPVPQTPTNVGDTVADNGCAGSRTASTPRPRCAGSPANWPGSPERPSARPPW
jgi:hypothetical protein